MNFEFTSGNPVLTKTIKQGGLGLTATDVAAVTVWQTNTDYVFNFHSGSHGNQCVYVIAADGSSGKKDFPCIWVEGNQAGSHRGLNKLKAKWSSEALAVVNANRALFLQMAQSFNT